MSAPFLLDSDWSLAQPTGAMRFTFPFPNDSLSFYIEQDYTQAIDDFDHLPLGSKLTVVTGKRTVTTYLVAESPTKDLGGGMVKWTRTYAMIPVSRTNYEQFAYTFPGIGQSFVGFDHLLIDNKNSTSDPQFDYLIYTPGAGASGTLAVGDSVFIFYDRTDPVGNVEVTEQAYRRTCWQSRMWLEATSKFRSI